ncbi:MAG: tandem-95 repeat protein, partial [Lutibacter sp.]|uniref:Ig-like domain-containing protein n=1 Tax=Lutibacter sp. TaxID=1925666 RepID=UPI00385C9E49
DATTVYTIAAGTTSLATPISITTINDGVYEPTVEDFTVTLNDVTINSPTTEAITTTVLTATGTIEDATSVPIISINATNQANEPDVNGMFTLNLTNPISIPTVISYSITGTATNGVDFQTIEDSIIIPENTYSISITVNVIDDLIIENTESVIIALESSSNAVLISSLVSESTATVNIIDNDFTDGVSGLSIDDVTVNESSGTATFTVTLIGAVQGGLTVDFTTVDGSAVQPGDYTTNSGTLSFDGTDGEEETIKVAITDDSVIELTESFTVDLSGLSTTLTVINDGEGIGTIIDSDIDVQDDTATTDEDTEVIISVLLNDTYGSDDVVVITDVTTPSNGTVVINADNTVTYSPNPDFNGEDSLDYTVTVTNSDGSTTTETATVIITVNPVSDVQDDIATTNEDEAVTISVLANDVFNASTEVAVTNVTTPLNGTVVINTDSTVTYTPNADFNGEDTFDYAVTVTNLDGSITTETATVTITVNPVGDIQDDTASTNEDEAVTISVLANDGFDASTEVAINDVTTPSNGTVVINADNTVTYTPNPDFNGEDSFDYTVMVTNSDGSTTTETATVSITINPVSDVQDDNAETIDQETVEIDVLANDSFDVNTAIEITSTTTPSSGSVEINSNGTVSYSANEGFYGEDVFEYTVTVANTDGSTTIETATVTVTVSLTPFAIDDEVVTDANIPIDIDVLENDYDEDGTINPESVVITEEPFNGTVVVNTDGTVTYTPNVDYIGDDTFVYQVCDNDGLCDTATVTVIVTGVLAAELIIPQGFSPNGDGVHDTFDITGLINLYPNFQLQIYNRYGNKVYDYTHNGNPLTQPIWWDGFSSGRMNINGKKQVPVGTYFYILHFNKDNAKPRSGYVYLNR